MKIADLSLDKKKKKTREETVFQDTYHYVSLEEQFSDVVKKYPERIALRDEYGMMDFKELNYFSSNLAHFILNLSNNKQVSVGIMCDRSRWFVASALAVLRAGAIYVPIDPNLPYVRKKEMLENCGAELLVVEQSTISDASNLVYDINGLRHLLCVDTENFETAIEGRTERMSRELWDQVTAERSDASWISMTTREPFPDAVIESLADNVYDKTKDCLQPGCSVLDIGSGSGKVAERIAGNCAKYTAIDLSSMELTRLESEFAIKYPELDYECHPYEAIDISILPDNSYDLIIMNSVAENFPGLNYFRSVLNSAVRLLKPGGTFFIGGILDPDTREKLYDELREFAQETGEIRGLLQLENRVDNYVPREFFQDWSKTSDMPVEITMSPSGIKEPELADYRYDLLIQKSEGTNNKPTGKPEKYFYGTDVFDNKTGNAIELPSLPSDQTAYIIFTSGSIGKPKGVVIQHDSLLNLADALDETVYQPVFKNEPQEIALVASFSFDASLQQLVMNYTRGHTLNIISDTMKREPGKMIDYYKRRTVALSDMTPSLFSMYLDHLNDHQMSTDTKVFILGGERLELELLDNFYRNGDHTDTRIINAYGPTECCVDSTLHVFTRANYRQYDVPPIGSPIKNSVIEVRDAKGRNVPHGIPGELWIGGRGVSTGYLNDFQSTEQQFRTEDGNKQLRWYLTGDYGRKTRDGVFQFIGREDDQVKIGGYRIELGEVESAFRKCPLIKDGVINAVDIGGNGTKVLIAYFIANGNTDVPGIKAFLQSVLPSHVVPSYYMQVENLPYSISGKINRKKLPLPSNEKTRTAKSKPLTNETEKKLAKLWQTLLGITIDDANADFFILGGHSVLAVRLMAMIEKEFGIRLPLSQLFKTSKISELAGIIDAGNSGQEVWNPLVIINETGDLAPIFFFHPVGGNVLCYQQLATELEKERPVYMLESPGLGEGQPSFNSVEEKVAFYLKYMIEAVPEGAVCLAGWSFGGVLAFEAARQLQLMGRKVDSLILLDTVAAKDKIRDLMQQDEAGFIYEMFGELLELDLEELRKLNSKKRIELVVERGVGKAVFPYDFDRKKMQVLLDIYMNNGLSSAKYVFKPWDGSALLIRPETISQSALNVENDELQGWENILQKGIQLEWVAGTHETLLQEPYIRDVSRYVLSYLNKTAESEK